MAEPPDDPPKGPPVPARDAHPPWAREDSTPATRNWTLDSLTSELAESTPPQPDEPPGTRLRKMRERMWGPMTDEEYAHGLEFGFSGVQVTYLKVTPDREPLKSMTKLRDARKKLQKLGEVVRDEAFDHWLRQHVVNAERPDEWTRSRVLYENYLKRAKDYGQNRQDKALSKQTLATETMWGKLMGAQFPNKKRTRDGWFYPVRLKQGA